MTRINLLPPIALSYQHLWAEHREITRIYDYVLKHGVNIERIPKKYCLGKGHVLFFANKLKYLLYRIYVIELELKRRKIKALYDTEKIKAYHWSILNNEKQILWIPSHEEINISAQCIYQKIAMKPNFYTYYKKGG